MKYKTCRKILIFIAVTIVCCSCATSQNVAKNDLDNQPYFPGCATITSKCNL